jgi:hypothetical protein
LEEPLDGVPEGERVVAFVTNDVAESIMRHSRSRSSDGVVERT